MECLSVLSDAARTSYNHPLRADVALEVLTLHFNKGHSPSEVRSAVESLASLLKASPQEPFHRVMSAIQPWRSNYLYAKDLPCFKFPVVALEVDTVSKLAAVEAFLAAGNSPRRTNDTDRIEVFLQMGVHNDPATGVSDYDFLVRAAKLVELLTCETSIFRLAMVEFKLNDLVDYSDRVLGAASKVCALALHHDTSTANGSSRECKVCLTIGGDTLANSSLATWGGLFQTVCRVDQQQETPSQAREDAEKEDGNTLQVSFAAGADAQAVAAFWSAVAFSNGYSQLQIDDAFDSNGGNPNDAVLKAKYMAMGFFVHDTRRTKQLQRIRWNKKELTMEEVEEMEQVQTSGSLNDLADILWTESVGRIAPVFEIPANSFGIARRYGFGLQDRRGDGTLDVLVPGFGQCRVTQHQWASIRGSGQDDAISTMDTTIVRGSSTVSHLHMEMDVALAETQLSLVCSFPLIGTALVTLQLESSKNPLTAQGLLSIFQSCPLLRELVINTIEPPHVSSIVFDPSSIVSINLVKLHLRLSQHPPPSTHSGTMASATTTDVSFFGMLIPLVARCLEYLEVRRQSTIVPFTNDFAAIVRSCPSLYHLKLECLDIGTLDPLIEMYRQGNCRVSSLYLAKCPVESASVVRFAAFLSDRACLASHKLGVFHISEATSDPHDQPQLRALNASTLHALVAMLAVNRTLTELYVGVCDSQTQFHGEPLRPFSGRFSLYDEQEIPLMSESYPLQETLAFVGALQVNQLPWNPEIIRVIREFAAQRVRRSVRFEVMDRF